MDTCIGRDGAPRCPPLALPFFSQRNVPNKAARKKHESAGEVIAAR